MQLKITRDADRLTAHLIGELDHHTAAEVREKIDAAILQGRCAMLVLDLSGLTFMDSSGIGLIMGRYRLIRSLGSTMRLHGATKRMQTVLRLAGMEKLPIWDDNTERMQSR